MPGTKAQDDVIPGLQLDDKLAAKLDSLDDQLLPIEPEGKVKENGKSASKEEEAAGDDSQEEAAAEDQGAESEEDDAGASEDGSDDSSSDDGDSGADGDKGDGDSDEGYTIDESDEEPEAGAEDKSVEEPKAEQASNRTPEQQYIIANIQAIKVRGTVGDSTEVKEFEVYSPEYLPSGFKYVDDAEASMANKAFNTLENRAVQLQQDFRNQETQKATKEFKQREDLADRQDIATLQRAGELPLFKADPNSAAFDNDPGVKLVQDILDFKEEQNNKYLEQYNAGRPWKHIGFEEAFRLFRASNPTKSNPAQAKEDGERKGIAKRTSKSNGSSNQTEGNKPRVHSGMSTMDLDALIESKTRDW